MPSEKSPPYSSLATEKRDFPPTPINIAFQGSKATKRLPQCGDGGGEAWELMQINLRKGGLEGLACCSPWGCKE